MQLAISIIALILDFTRQFLKTYNVRYIIVGELERAAYTPEGLAKFKAFDGKYWHTVYQDGNTVIYEVGAVMLTHLRFS